MTNNDQGPQMQAAPTDVTGSGDDYIDFLQDMRRGVNDAVAHERALFTTDATGLWDAFIGTLPEHERAHHDCHACRHFVERYGGLVTISDTGHATPVMWPEHGAELYHASFNAAATIVRRARVTGVFVTTDKLLGTLVNRDGKRPGVLWHHMAVTLPASLVAPRHPLRTPGQVMAEKVEDYGMLQRALAEFPPAVVEQALGLLRADTLYRSEKVLGVAEWLHALHAARSDAQGRVLRDNVTWRAVASAPAGFCHVRSSMIGTLLEDIASGLDFAAVKHRFAEKMHPLQYQRPQAAPSAGNIAQAEAVVARLGIAASLRRRYARLDEVQAIWRPTIVAPQEQGGSVFGHLLPKAAPPLITGQAPPMTWAKFARDVLPHATQIEYFTQGRNYTALVTAADPDAPPILQWDSPERRNPVSWYCWHGGASPAQFSLPERAWVKVNAICLLPSQWNGGHEHHGEGAIVILDGARETRPAPLCLFPEFLRGELREVRATIEAYSRSRFIEDREQGSACGADLRKGGSRWEARMRVHVRSGAVVIDYVVDRWE